jgi:hypothetical protein
MNKIQWRRVPQCEVCGNEPATSFSWFKDDGTWKFCGDCTRETETYYIQFNSIFKSPSSTVDWLAHMHEKNWMNWQVFGDMMHRFRAATDSFHET